MTDDAEARRRRARQLRRQIEEVDDGRQSEPPPRSPREFIEREMRERTETPHEEGGPESREQTEMEADDS